MFRRPVSWVTIALLVAACDPEAGTTEDGGAPDGGAPDASAMIAAPVAPALPTMTPCPAGFLEVALPEGLTVCEPWAEGAAPDCADHEARFVGSEGCARLGTACPSDGWPEGAPAGALYVRAGATGSAGSRADPFGTIGEALAVATPGDTIAIAVGDYQESLDVPMDLTLLGACAEGVVSSSPSFSSTAGVITISGGARVAVQNLSIGESGRIGLYVKDAGTIADVSDVALNGTTAVGLYAELTSTLNVDRVVVRGTQTTSGIFGRGASFETGATAALRNLVIEGGAEQGIYVTGEGTSLVLEDASITDVAPVAAGRGSGIACVNGASVEMRRAFLSGLREGGVVAVGEGTRFVLEDTIIRDVTGADVTPALGRGVVAQQGASLEARRVFLDRTRDTGFFVGDASAIAEDLVIRDVAVAPDGLFGRGLSSQQMSSLEARRTWVGGVHGAGIAVFGGTLTAQDLTIDGVASEPASGSGRGMVAQDGAVVRVERAHLRNLIEVGLFAEADSTTFAASDIRIEEVVSRDDNGFFGRGVLAQSGAEITLEGVSVSGVLDVGVMGTLGARVVARDLRIIDVGLAGCDMTTCGLFGAGGHALGAYANGSASITRFEFRGAALCGIHVDGGASVSLDDGEIAETEIGACVQSAAQDLAALDGVRYVDNGRNLDATSLPVPMTAEGLGQ